jgi:SHS2 domain-containing protein
LYRWVDHTAEVEIEIEAGSEQEVFADALRALAELLGARNDGDSPAQHEQRTVEVSAADRPAMLAGWLEELLFLAESEGFVATRVETLVLRDRELAATVAGRLDDPPPLVKAVTYHRLEFERGGRGYVARLVLDV